MEHKHNSGQVSSRKLLFTIILNVIITAAQIVGGFISGSLALISDAIHNLSDAVSVVLAYLAQILGGKPTTTKSTFGYKRAEIFAAFINAVVLIGISIFLIFEAFNRITNLKEVDAKWMFWLGLLGLFANGISVIILEREKNQSINIKAAYLHLLGDALTSVAVVVGALLIWFFEIYWIDPIITIIISVYLFVHTFHLLKESVTILMQMVPSEISVPDIKKRLHQMEGIDSAHHIHVWNLTDKQIHFECHLVLNNDVRVSETNPILESVQQILHDEFGIEHVTIQFEFEPNHKEPSDC